MRTIKLYEEFWGKSKSENEDLEFDFLAAVGRCKNAINKVIEVHEKHYYQDNKITQNQEFQSDLRSYIDLKLTGEGGLDELLDLVKDYENKLYNDTKFGIDSDDDYSMFGLFEDLTTSLWATVKDKTERRIHHLNKTAQDILDKCDDSWVYREGFDDSVKKSRDILDTIDLEELDYNDEDDSDVFERWETSEGLQQDLEKYIGKSLGEFEYGDKLRAYKYVSENETIKYILAEGNEQEVQQVNNFLKSLKDFFQL